MVFHRLQNNADPFAVDYIKLWLVSEIFRLLQTQAGVPLLGFCNFLANLANEEISGESISPT